MDFSSKVFSLFLSFLLLGLLSNRSWGEERQTFADYAGDILNAGDRTARAKGTESAEDADEKRKEANEAYYDGHFNRAKDLEEEAKELEEKAKRYFDQADAFRQAAEDAAKAGEAVTPPETPQNYPELAKNLADKFLKPWTDRPSPEVSSPLEKGIEALKDHPDLANYNGTLTKFSEAYDKTYNKLSGFRAANRTAGRKWDEGVPGAVFGPYDKNSDQGLAAFFSGLEALAP